MIAPFDIFKVDPYGDVRWFEPARDIESAKGRLRTQGAAMRGKHASLARLPGKQRFFTVEENGEVSEGVD
jgi:hypothetical protein